MADGALPMVAVIETQRDLATALEEVVSLARCTPISVPDVSGLTDLPSPPAAIVVRIATNMPFGAPHAGLEDLPAVDRPKVLALVSSDADVTEAQRLGCDLVLREPHQVRALYDALTAVAASTPRATS